VPELIRPISLRRDGDTLAIQWSDGFLGAIPLQKLRDACPCATCNEKRLQPPNPLRILSDTELRAGAPAPVAMPARGAYAYQIVWNDGHDTGIFTLELLRKLCEPAAQPSKHA
jgi:DUF971 family protein